MPRGLEGPVGQVANGGMFYMELPNLRVGFSAMDPDHRCALQHEDIDARQTHTERLDLGACIPKTGEWNKMGSNREHGNIYSGG